MSFVGSFFSYDDNIRDHLRENLISSWQDCHDSDHRVSAHNDLLNITTPIDDGLYGNKHLMPAASHCKQRNLVRIQTDVTAILNNTAVVISV